MLPNEEDEPAYTYSEPKIDILEYYIVESHCEEMKIRLQHIQKAEKVRQQKIDRLSSQSHSNNPDEIMEEKISELKMQMEIETSKLVKLRDEYSTKDIAVILKLENDILMVNIRALSIKIDEIDTRLEMVKTAHKKVIGQLSKARHVNSNSIQMNKLIEELKNTKNDLYQAKQLIYELEKVAYTMLPNKLSIYCSMIQQKNLTIRARYDELTLGNFNMHCSILCSRRELDALKASYEGEMTLAQLYKQKIAKVSKTLDDGKKKLSKLTAIVYLGHQKLRKKGYTLTSALERAKRLEKEGKLNLVEEIHHEKLLQRNRSVVLEKEKIEFLHEKSAELDKELEIVRKEYHNAKTVHSQLTDDAKKVADCKHEIEQLKERKEIMLIELQQEVLMRKTYFNEIEDLKGKIRVFCRCRPISKEEIHRGNLQCCKFPDIYTVMVHGVTKEKKPREFQFDRVFNMDSTQEEVFLDTSKLIQSAFDGYNVCIFAYGQTGSGKTFTLIGNLTNNPGIAPRSFERIFEIIADSHAKFTAVLKCYMLELYNEKLLDLFTPGAEYSDKLEIKKDPHGMVIVPGAMLASAKTSTELRELFLKGNSNRHIASTKMNSESSRSHLIISIMISCTMFQSGKIVRGKMSIIDLAGSERMAKSGVKGVGAQEAMAINMSLSALGDVIAALTSGQPFVPYRNNKLTMLMQDSLGGNAKTLMFVNISPVDYNAVETASSLTYAARVKLIKNDATKVHDVEEIAKLQNIIEELLDGQQTDL